MTLVVAAGSQLLQSTTGIRRTPSFLPLAAMPIHNMTIGTPQEIRALVARKQELCELHNRRGNSILGPSFDWWINDAGTIDPTITAERKALQASIKEQVIALDKRIKHLSKDTPAEGLAKLAVLTGVFVMVTAIPYLVLVPLRLGFVAVGIALIYYLGYAAQLNDNICWRGRRAGK